MNKFTLTFADDQLEQQYRGQQHHSELALYKRNTQLLLITLTLWMVLYIIQSQIILMTTMILFMTIFAALYFLAYKSPHRLDFTIFFVQMFMVICIPLNYVLHRQTGSSQSQYFQGTSTGYAWFGFMIGTRFYLKSIALFLNVVATVWVYAVIEDQLTDFFYNSSLFLIYGLMTYFRLYYEDHHKRQWFLLRKVQTQWQNGLDQTLSVPILTIGIDKSNGMLKLLQVNKVAQYKLNLQSEDQMGFRNFLRQFMVLSGQLLGFKQGQKINLEQFVLKILIHSDGDRPKKRLSIFENHLILRCQRQVQIHQILIFQTYENDELIVNLFMDRHKSIKQIDRVLLKKLNTKKVLQDITTSCQETTRKALIALKALSLRQPPGYSITQKYLLDSTTNMYRQYLSLLNTQTIFGNIVQLGELQAITLKQLCRMMYHMTKAEFIRKRLRFRFLDIFRLQDIKLQTQERLIVQVMLNVLLNALEHAKPRTSIVMQAKTHSIDELGQRVIEIGIQNKGEKFTKNRLSHSLENKYQGYHTFYKVPEQSAWGLTVVSYLLSFIGPENSIKIDSKNIEGKTRVSFLIFENLTHVPKRRLTVNKLAPKIIFDNDDDE